MEVAPAGGVFLWTITAAAPTAKRHARRLTVEVLSWSRDTQRRICNYARVQHFNWRGTKRLCICRLPLKIERDYNKPLIWRKHGI